MKRYLDKKVHFSTDEVVILSDLNSVVDPDYQKLFEQFRMADGMRDIAICESCSPTDTEHLLKQVRQGKMSYVCIGWLPFIVNFVRAAEKKKMTACEYADWLYDQCKQVNKEVGYRAAWIEAYGEIGNSINWPKEIMFTKAEALQYFRDWLRNGRMLSEHWGRLMPRKAMNYYTHAKLHSKDLRNLPIYYSEGTLFSIQEAYRNGFPLVVYEPQCGTMNAIQTGVAFVRGGAKIYDAWWGIDFSPWTGGPLGDMAKVNSVGKWCMGVTPDHMFRAWITAYMSGCNTLLHEVSYRFFYAESEPGMKILSDYGHCAAQFYSVTKSVLKNRGVPVVPFAVMLEKAHGYRGDMSRTFDKKGNLNSSDVSIAAAAYRKQQSAGERLFIWNGKTKVTRDDWGIHRLVETIWPIAPGSWADLGANKWPDKGIPMLTPEKQNQLFSELSIAEKDPRDFHRFLAVNRWTDCFDFILETAPVKRVQKYYKVIMLAGGVRTSPQNWDKIVAFMKKGGEVIASIDQLTSEVRKQLGLTCSPEPKLKNIKKIQYDGQSIKVDEKLRLYKIASKKSRIWAIDQSNTPLIIYSGVGKGGIYILLFTNGITASANGLGHAFTVLIDKLHAKHVGVHHNGPPCQLLVNQRLQDTLITVMNPCSVDWHANIVVSRDGKPLIKEVYDVLAGVVFPKTLIVADKCSVSARVRVPAHEVRVLAFGTAPKLSSKKSSATPFRSSKDLKALERIRKSDPFQILK